MVGDGWRRIRSLRRFAREDCGNAAVVFALVLLPLLAGAGLALDSLLAFTVQERLQRSVDAAGLAAGSTIDPANIVADARAFFRSNFDAAPNLALADDPTVQVSANGEEITVAASATMPTRFMRLVGHDSITISASSLVNRATQGMELVLVLDSTGSMVTDNRIAGLKAAAKELLEIVYGNRNTVPDLWVGVVPYIASVNVGVANADFLALTDGAIATPSIFGTDGWGGCVLARPAPRDLNDDPPDVQNFHSYLYPVVTDHPSNVTEWQWENIWPPLARTVAAYTNGVLHLYRTGPNAGCPAPITPLVAEKSKIVAAVDALMPEFRSGTIVSEGVAWGWRALSPRWRGRWSGSPGSLPLAYNTPNMSKVMVVLTDGDNQMLVRPVGGTMSSPYSTYRNYINLGASTSDSAAAAKLDEKTRSVCTQVKATGILVYSLTVGSSVTSIGKALARDCASSPSHYWHAPTNDNLRATFRTIGTQLNNLRVKR